MTHDIWTVLLTTTVSLNHITNMNGTKDRGYCWTFPSSSLCMSSCTFPTDACSAQYSRINSKHISFRVEGKSSYVKTLAWPFNPTASTTVPWSLSLVGWVQWPARTAGVWRRSSPCRTPAPVGTAARAWTQSGAAGSGRAGCCAGTTPAAPLRRDRAPRWLPWPASVCPPPL